MVKKMADIRQFVRKEMIWAQALQEEYVNRKRSPAPTYQVGNMVWLDARNIRTKRPSKKLDSKALGKYRISKIISPYAYRLELPESMKIYPTQHVSLFRPVVPESEYLLGQLNPPPASL